MGDLHVHVHVHVPDMCVPQTDAQGLKKKQCSGRLTQCVERSRLRTLALSVLTLQYGSPMSRLTL